MDSGSPSGSAPVSADRLDARVLLGELREKMFGQRSVARAGRFELRRRLGRGAFGSVYLAYDPTLERKVAVKLLDETIAGPEHRARLLREAKALARLEHPNVLTVYDVTVVDGQIVIAMELVEGGTLASWCRSNPVGTRARFDALFEIAVGIGQGLAAAHDAGITHRDIKPANILVGDGRPRLADFGIARATTFGASDRAAHEDETFDGQTVPMRLDDPADTHLTHSRTAAGTPAFMAPEQFDGRADAASDQWGLCATLWLAAYGEPAFDGDTVPERVAAIGRPPQEPPGPDRGVPAWFGEILARGLQPDPVDRWPSVAELCTAFERATARERRRPFRIAMAMLGAGAVIGLAGWGLQRLDLQRRLAACDRHAASIEEVWNDADRTALRASFVATEAGHAQTSADKVSALVDERVRAWGVVRVQACRAEVLGDWDADTLDRALWCLDDRQVQLDAVVTRLQQADVTALTKAVAAVTRLRDVQPCGDPVTLARLPLPDEDRAQVSAIMAQLQDAAALESIGAYARGLEVARAQLEPANELGWMPLIASVQTHIGSVLTRTGDFAEAEAMLESAYFTAVEAAATEEALGAAQMLVYVVGTGQSRYEDGRKWWEHSETLRRQLPDDAGVREAVASSNLGRLEYGRGAYREAVELHEHALALRERAFGPEHPMVANSLADLANTRHAMGAYDEATELNARALELRRAALGPDHPYVAAILNNLAEIHKAVGSIDDAGALHDEALKIREAALGAMHPDVAASLNNVANVLVAKGDLEGAATHHRRALEIREAALGVDHPDVAQSLSNLADVHRASGDYEAAARDYQRALAILEVALGPEHVSVAHTLNNLGIVHYQRGNLEQAKVRYERALAIREATLGPEHPLVGESLTNVAVVAFETCALTEAERLYARALRILEAVRGPEHPDLGYPLLGLARVAIAQHRVGDAVHAERALTLRAEAGAPMLAEARFVLAQSLVESGSDRERAIRLATQARDAYREAGAAYDGARVEAETWLEAVASGAVAGRCD